MGEPFYLTPSRISGALQCGLRYWRQYVEKIDGDKGTLNMFAGSMQHEALDEWASNGTALLDAHRERWFAEGPDWLTSMKSAKKEDRRRFSPLGLYLKYRNDLCVITQAEDELAARLMAENPKIKEPRRTKLFKEESAKLDPGGTRARLEQTISTVETWFYSDKSPWQPKAASPIAAFVENEIALTAFDEWWLSLGDGAPDIVHTEAKARILLPTDDPRFTITGVIDKVEVWPDGTTDVVDYKRSAGREDDIAHFVQAAVYALTCVEVVGIEPDRVVFHHLKEGSRLVYDVKPSWTEQLLGLADRVKRMHDAEDFAPSFRTCSWCDYRRMCHEMFEFDATTESARIEEAA